MCGMRSSVSLSIRSVGLAASSESCGSLGGCGQVVVAERLPQKCEDLLSGGEAIGQAAHDAGGLAVFIPYASDVGKLKAEAAFGRAVRCEVTLARKREQAVVFIGQCLAAILNRQGCKRLRAAAQGCDGKHAPCSEASQRREVGHGFSE